jgi:membrane associated rhomboid family serine protease
MLIPLGTDRPLRRPTLATYLLIGLNVAVFVVMSALEKSNPELYQSLSSWGMLSPPGSPGAGGPGMGGFMWWNLFSYAFLHSGAMHLGGNMLILFVFGPNLEDRLGRLWFLLFYLLGAAAAGGLHIAFSRHPVVGASGAIAGCTGAYFVLFPRTQIKAIFLLAFGSITHISAWWFIAFSVCWELAAQGIGRAGLSWGAEDNVAHLAHFGGYAFGIAVAFTLLWLKLVPREPYDLFTLGKQAYRRRQFKEAGHAAQQKVRKHWDKAQQSEASGGGGGGGGGADALAAARADVIAKINAADLPAAAAAYKQLADTYANVIGGATLSRRYQYDLANHFYAVKDHNAAAFAYARFLEAYPKDPEAGHIKLLLGMIHARALNDPVKAKQLIQDSLKDLDEANAELARNELEALG